MAFHTLRIRNIILFTISALLAVDFIDALQESFIDSGIVITEEIIRNTINNLFAILKLKRDNTRLNQYLIINKHFASITIQENDHLKEISRLSRVNTASNGSTVFMAAINELLNDDNHNVDENEIKYDAIVEKYDDHVVNIIEAFLEKLRHARELHDANSYININDKVLNLIEKGRTENTTSYNNEDVEYMALNTTSEDMEFWKPSGRRIYGGKRTKIKHFPFMASIQMLNNFQCAGSIIKSDLIITASSCLQLAWNNRFFRENPAFLAVRVGSSFYNGGGEVISVLEIYFHPAYDPKTLRNNICVVRLTRKIKFSWRARRRVRKIDIDRHANNLPYNTPGITILGWGAKGRSNVVRDPWTNILSYSVLDVYPLRECQEVYSNEYVTHKNFCAGFMSRGGGACNRDVGGPGIDEGILVGVVSFGSPVCGAADAPTVFTKLGYYADWIESIMEQEVPTSKKRTTSKPLKPPMKMRHTTLGSTTYKISPLTGEIMKPTAINEIDNILRMFDDDLFHEFMKTMFDSKEVAEYEHSFKDIKQETFTKMPEGGKNVDGDGEEYGKNISTNDKQTLKGTLQILQDEMKLSQEEQSVTSPYNDARSEPVTKLIDFEADSEETITDSNKYTVISGDNAPKSDKLDNNIAELTKNIDFKKIIKEEAIVAKKKEANAVTEPVFIDDIRLQPDGSQKNDSVLTVLYLSEENKDKDKVYEESSENAKGLSIAAESFQDLTRSKGKSKSTYNSLPEKELYEILSEVIDDEIRNNESKL